MKSGNKPEAGKVKERTPKRQLTGEGQHRATKSVRHYDAQTLKVLWGRAAGRCAMPNCRIELFGTELGYDPICIIGEMGHVIASSDAGPRGNSAASLTTRDKYENLILLCRNCHRRIDVLHEKYPPIRLQQLKADHESWVRTALPERGASNVLWTVLSLRGDFPFDATTISEALSPDQIATQTQLVVSPTRSAWTAIQEDLRRKVEELTTHENPIVSRIAVFPLAQVSACLYCGFLLTNRMNVRGFQYHRDVSSWVWPKTEQALSMPAYLQVVDSPSATPDLLFIFQLSAPVFIEDLRREIGGEQAVYECSVPDTSSGWLKSKSQLDELGRKTREMFEVASIRYPQSPRWHILYAGPAPGAVIVGQQLNPTMIPPVQLYEFQRPKHIASIAITPADSTLTRWAL